MRSHTVLLYIYIETWKAGDDAPKSLRGGLLGKLDLAHVEGPDTADGIARVDDGWRPTLGPREDDVHERIRIRDLL